MSAYNHSVVCTDCLAFMRPFRSGVTVLELDYQNRPYIVYYADIYECPKCDLRVVTGFGRGTHYSTLRPDQQKRINAEFVIGE